MCQVAPQLELPLRGPLSLQLLGPASRFAFGVSLINHLGDPFPQLTLAHGPMALLAPTGPRSDVVRNLIPECLLARSSRLHDRRTRPVYGGWKSQCVPEFRERSVGFQ